MFQAVAARKTGWRRAGVPSRSAIDIAFVLVSCVLCFAYLADRPLSHDISWYLVSGRRWLEGAVLYRDIIEVNPPLAYFEIAPILKLPIADTLGYLLAMHVLIAASCLWVRRLAMRDGRISTHVATVASTAALLIVPLGDFGQREHVALAAALPYLWAMAFGTRVSRAESIALGAFAFVGLGLKPYFLAIPAGVSLVAAIRRRSIRPLFAPANLALAALCVGYAVLVVLAFPDYLGAVVPMARLTYFAYGLPPVVVLSQPTLLVAIPLIVIGLRTGGATASLAGALAGAVVCYLIQFKGWPYHQIPIGGLALIMVAVLFTDRESAHPRRPATTIIAALAVFTVLTPAMHGSYRVNPIQHRLAPYLAGARSALILGENVWLAFPLVENLHIYHASRYCAAWPLPGATIIARRLSDSRAEAARRVLRETRSNMVGDFIRARPDMLVVDARAYKPYFRGSFDYVAFLSGDPRFGPVFAKYEKAGHVGWLDVYRRKG